jgi:diacylglycerol O-acyltransferase
VRSVDTRRGAVAGGRPEEQPQDLGLLSEAEALMWRAEADPMLSSVVGVLAVLDRPPDHDALRRRLAAGIASHPHLAARVLDRPLEPLRWAPVRSLDLAHHLGHERLPAGSEDRALLDLACRLTAEPMDRSRPLWRMWTVSGLRRGRGALIWQLHHALTDGQGALGLAELFVDLERRPAVVPELDPADLDEVLARRADAAAAGSARLLRRAVGEPLGIARRIAGDVLLAGADPRWARERVGEATGDLRRVGRQLGGGAGSELWRERSTGRHLSVVRLPIASVRRTARALGGSVNDVFVGTVVHAAAEVHRAAGRPLDRLAVSFIVSTRTPGADGRNAFVPVRMSVPMGGLDALGRFRATLTALGEARPGATDGGVVGVLTSLAAALPSPVVTRAVRSQAAALDLATSCLRGPELPLFVAGARVGWVVPIGPVAGTPANITALTYNTELAIGVHADPAAVADPGALTAAIEAAYCDLVRASGVPS